MCWFKKHEFHHVNTPILTANDCEGAGEAFRIAPVPRTSAQEKENATPDNQPTSSSSSRTASAPVDEFFGRPAYLTVSSQLHLEALAPALSRVYTLSPTFRAERGVTHRHLSEFWMLEAEFSFCERADDVMDVVEGLIKHALNDVRAAAAAELRVLGGAADPAHEDRLAELSATFGAPAAWPRISYADAVKELAAQHAVAKGGFQFAPAWGAGLQSEHEKWLAGTLAKGPVFVTDYPAALKPFYMRHNDDPRDTVACFDLLVPRVGELVGGSLREERLGHLERALASHGLPTADFEWYLDLRRFGSVPHGGFGLGFERLVSWISDVENIRECIPFPRWPGKMML